MTRAHRFITAMVNFGLLLLSSHAFAGPTMNASIEKIRIRPTIAYVKLQGCARYNQIRLDSEYGKAMYAAALTAATSGRNLFVQFQADDGCATVESEFILLEVVY